MAIRTKTPETDKTVKTLPCVRCDRDLPEKNFYRTNTLFYPTGRVSICQKCLDELFDMLSMSYKNQGCTEPERDAIKRICQVCDFWWSEKLYSASVKALEAKPKQTIFAAYMSRTNLNQFSKYSYSDTILEERKQINAEAERLAAIEVERINAAYRVERGDLPGTVHEDGTPNLRPEIITLFGVGLGISDYAFLQQQYDSWSQQFDVEKIEVRELVKAICLNRLQAQKIMLGGEGDISKINTDFMKLMDSGNMTPKQNINDGLAQRETFGTLLETLEQTEPVGEPDDDLKDVDRIQKYINAVYRGPIGDYFGLKGGYTKDYEEFMRMYSVEPPEATEEDSTAAIKDAIFASKPDGPVSEYRDEDGRGEDGEANG